MAIGPLGSIGPPFSGDVYFARCAICPNRPLTFRFSASWRSGCLSPPPVFRIVVFGRCSILAVLGPYFPIKALQAPRGLSAHVVGVEVFWSLQLYGRAIPLFLDLWHPGAWRSSGPVFQRAVFWFARYDRRAALLFFYLWIIRARRFHWAAFSK